MLFLPSSLDRVGRIESGAPQAFTDGPMLINHSSYVAPLAIKLAESHEYCGRKTQDLFFTPPTSGGASKRMLPPIFSGGWQGFRPSATQNGILTSSSPVAINDSRPKFSPRRGYAGMSPRADRGGLGTSVSNTKMQPRTYPCEASKYALKGTSG